MSTPRRRRLLITGAAGWVGRRLRRALRRDYVLRLLDVRPMEGDDLATGAAEAIVGTMTDPDTMRRACEGVDTVLHLGIGVRPDGTRPGDLIVDTDQVGTYWAHEAAREQGCRRVIFASSVSAITMYDHRRQFVTEEMPARPGGVYGLSKVFGEMLGRQYAESGALTAVAIRLFTPNSYKTARQRALGGDTWLLESWLSPRDMAQLFRRSIESEHIHFELFHGLSNNTRRRWSIQRAVEVVGYRPEDDAERLLAPDWVAPEDP
ncbi:MAG: NAD(P)-dependent oxidoreductase [Gemmatimonadota bacterium]